MPRKRSEAAKANVAFDRLAIEAGHSGRSKQLQELLAEREILCQRLMETQTEINKLTNTQANYGRLSDDRPRLVEQKIINASD